MTPHNTSQEELLKELQTSAAGPVSYTHLVEQGNHESLLQKGGFYAELYNSQFDHD